MDAREELIRRLLEYRRVAIVGLSDDPTRPSHEIAGYLLKSGYQIVPVNPNCREVLGQKSVATLKEAAGRFDLVNVFRRSEYCEAVTRDAIAAGAKGIWLQLGISNDAAEILAREAGIDFIQDRCIKVEHRIHR